MRVFYLACFAVVLVAATGCGTETESATDRSSSTVDSAASPTTASTVKTATSTTSTTTSTTASTSTTAVSTTTTETPTTKTLLATSQATTTLPTTTLSATTQTTLSATTQTTLSATTQTTAAEPVETTEPPVAYEDWDQFWAAFSTAAIAGDLATVNALTASEMTFVYAGGSVTSWKGPKEEFIGTFARPHEEFDLNRQTLDDGTVFTARLRAAGDRSSFEGFDVEYVFAYSVFIEESEGGPASATEYIFDKVDGAYLLVGYSVDT